MTPLNQQPDCDLSDALRVHLLGVVDFDSALFLQERLVYEFSGRNDRSGGLLVCEHPPLITMGREASFAQLRATPNELRSLQLKTRWVKRGGSAVVHLPGQLAIYPILPLDRIGLGLTQLRKALETSVLETCLDLKVTAGLRDDQPGVWTRNGQVAQLGVSVRSFVSYHGIFVNVCPDLDLQRLVVPQNRGDRFSSLTASCGRPVAMHAARECLVRHLTTNLGYDQFHLFTGHPLLKRTKRKVHVNA